MDIWFTSDTHFSHANFLNFEDGKGKKIRPFETVEEMDETMIANWNSVVKDGDRVYHLGDVSFNKHKLTSIMPRLRGSKRLILGNHDDIKDYKLLDYFKKVSLWRLFKDHNFICTHVPLAHDQMRKASFNVHGHIHEKPEPSAQHICICVERTNYTPLHIDEITAEIGRRSLLAA